MVGETATEIQRGVDDMINWLIEKVNRQWMNVFDYLQRHGSVTHDKLVGQLSTPFDYQRYTFIVISEIMSHISSPLRGSIFNKFSSGVDSVVRTYDKSTEAKKITSEVTGALYKTAAVEVGKCWILNRLCYTLIG